MDWVGTFFALCAFVMREAALFAAMGFVLLGVNVASISSGWHASGRKGFFAKAQRR